MYIFSITLQLGSSQSKLTPFHNTGFCFLAVSFWRNSLNDIIYVCNIKKGLAIMFLKTITILKAHQFVVSQFKCKTHIEGNSPGAINCLTLVDLDLSATLAMKQPLGTVHSVGLTFLSLSSAVSYTSM